MITRSKSLLSSAREVGLIGLACAIGITARGTQAQTPMLASAHETIRPIWTDARFVTTSSDHSRSERLAPTYVGLASPELRQIAADLMKSRYPFAAFALIRFDPERALAHGSWTLTLSGIPTAHTLDIGAKAGETLVTDPSLEVIWGAPYVVAPPIYAQISVITEDEGKSGFVSTIVARTYGGGGELLADGLLLETPVRFTWSRDEHRLLSVYEVTH